MLNELIKYAEGLSAPTNVFVWLENREKQNKLINQGEVEHIIDFFLSDSAPKNFVRMSYDAALKKSQEWVKKMNDKAKEIKESKNDTEVALDFKDGFKFVKLVGENAYKREGYLMGHCVSSYFGKDDEIYSLRDSKNMPHCTISKQSQQIKGKGNGSIHPKYVGYVVQFLEYLGIEVRDSEMQNLGYINLEPILPEIDTKNLDLFREKYLFKDSPKDFLDKNGKQYFDFKLWRLFPVLSINKNYEVNFNFNISDFISSAISYVLDTLANESYSTAVARGSYSTAVANESYSTAVANAHSSTAVARGSYSTAVARGVESMVEVNSINSVGLAFGAKSKAKGKTGAWIVLVEWDEQGENILHVEAFLIDGDKIKEDIYYELKNKKIIEFVKS